LFYNAVTRVTTLRFCAPRCKKTDFSLYWMMIYFLRCVRDGKGGEAGHRRERVQRATEEAEAIAEPWTARPDGAECEARSGGRERPDL